MKRSESNQVEEHISELHNGYGVAFVEYEIYSIDAITVIIINIIVIGIIGIISFGIAAWCIRFILTMISYMYVMRIHVLDVCVCVCCGGRGRGY